MDDLFPTPKQGTSTHEVVAARLRAMQSGDSRDVSKMTSCTIDLIDDTLYASALGYNKHQQWRTQRSFELIKFESERKNEEDTPNHTRSDSYLLANAIYTSDGKPLGTEMVEMLLGIPGSGPDVATLLFEAERLNPPREEMSSVVAQMLKKNMVECLMWKILKQCGLLHILVDFMSTHSTPEEAAEAARNLMKFEEVTLALQPIFDAEYIEKKLGITFTDSMGLLAEYKTVKDIMEARDKLIAAEQSEV